METRRNPIGRRPNPGSRIHLTSRKLIRQKAAAKRNLGKAARRATLAANEFPSEISKLGQIPARLGVFSYRNTAHCRTEALLPPPFPPQPLFPRLRSGQSLFQRPSPQKQIPSIQCNISPSKMAHLFCCGDRPQRLLPVAGISQP
jgi:hypothetical protein